MQPMSKTIALRDNGEKKVFKVPHAMPLDELEKLVKDEVPKARPILFLIEGYEK